jgi:hypothetical protein
MTIALGDLARCFMAGSPQGAVKENQPLTHGQKPDHIRNQIASQIS